MIIIIDLPQTRNISLKSYIKEINKSIEDRNYLSVLIISLMIPDICSNYLGWSGKEGEGYKKWYDKYVYDKNEIPEELIKKKYGKTLPETYLINFNGKMCYSLRCSILHEGMTPIEEKYLKQEELKKIKTIELSVNGSSNIENQYGEAKQIVNYGNTVQYTQRLNIVNLAKDIIGGCNDFLAEEGIEDIQLFTMIDWDRKGNIMFTPNK